MGITLKAMRYYCVALRCGSIVRAASELNVAASAVGAAIDQIEDHFQLTLTLRQRARGIQPTADGKQMAKRFQALIEDYDTLLRDGADRRQGLSGDLHIGYYAPVAPAFLPSVFESLTSDSDDMTLHLEACDNAAVQDGLRRGDFDAILFVADAVEPWVEFEPLIKAPPYCLLASDHPLARSPTLSLHEIATQKLVSLQRPMVGDYYRQLFEAVGQSPKITAYSNSTEMVRSLVGASDACAILNMLPLTNVSYAGDTLVARPICDALPPLTVAVGTARGRQRRAVQTFVSRCKAYFAAPGDLVCPAH